MAPVPGGPSTHWGFGMLVSEGAFMPIVSGPWFDAVARGALQFALVPPCWPAHVHDHGPDPVTAEAVPAEHRFALGALDAGRLLALPHAPLTATDAPGLNCTSTQ